LLQKKYKTHGSGEECRGIKYSKLAQVIDRLIKLNR
jgi:hypothetical protein